MPVAALIGVSEHLVEPLLREKELFKRFAGVWREPKRLRATGVRHDPQRREAKGKQMPSGRDGAGADF
jgi:hypothetical protein